MPLTLKFSVRSIWLRFQVWYSNSWDKYGILTLGTSVLLSPLKFCSVVFNYILQILWRLHLGTDSNIASSPCNQANEVLRQMAKRTVTNNTGQSISPKDLSINLTEGKRVAASNKELSWWLLSVKKNYKERKKQDLFILEKSNKSNNNSIELKNQPSIYDLLSLNASSLHEDLNCQTISCSFISTVFQKGRMSENKCQLPVFSFLKCADTCLSWGRSQLLTDGQFTFWCTILTCDC